MILLIAGSRSLEPKIKEIRNFIEWFRLQPTCIISGGAGGVDTQAKLFANNFDFKFIEFKADWDKYGKGAGHIRNGEMARVADACLLIWDGSSKGSANMFNQMIQQKKPVYQVILRDGYEHRIKPK